MSGFNGGAVAPIQIANNLTTTSAGYALDARQGNVLDERLSSVEESISSITTVGPAEQVDIDWQNAEPLPFRSLCFTIPIEQSGSGTPSSSNVRPFISKNNFDIYYLKHPSAIPIMSLANLEMGTSRYSGTYDLANKKFIQTHGHIASYNGESLPGMWYSSMDVYSAGTTPTIGAEVVYELAEPEEEQWPTSDWGNANQYEIFKVSSGLSTVTASYFIKESVLHKSDVVDNLTSTATNKPLSANMGHEIDSRLDKFSTDTGIIVRLDNTDINTIKQTGNYYAQASCQNAISGGGYLTVFAYDNSYVLQTMYPYNATQIYVRVLNNGTWSNWQRMIRENDIQFGRITTGEAISANTIYEMSVTYPNAYTTISYPVVSLVCWTDPSTISWIIKSYSVSGFTVRIKSTNNIAAGDLWLIWTSHGQ